MIFSYFHAEIHLKRMNREQCQTKTTENGPQYFFFLHFGILYAKSAHKNWVVERDSDQSHNFTAQFEEPGKPKTTTTKVKI